MPQMNCQFGLCLYDLRAPYHSSSCPRMIGPIRLRCPHLEFGGATDVTLRVLAVGFSHCELEGSNRAHLQKVGGTGQWCGKNNKRTRVDTLRWKFRDGKCITKVHNLDSNPYIHRERYHKFGNGDLKAGIWLRAERVAWTPSRQVVYRTKARR